MTRTPKCAFGAKVIFLVITVAKYVASVPTAEENACAKTSSCNWKAVIETKQAVAM